MDATEVHGVRRSDVVVIGGGAAGLAAALQLGRSLRSVVVVDGGEPRNAPAAHMHSYLGHDGRPPAEFLAIGREEVGRYGVELVEGRVLAVTHDHDGGFRAALADGTAVLARRVLVATGLVDVLPEIPGVAEQWGRGVLHCPYCHGWEVRDQVLVVIGTGPAGFHQAALFRQLSDDVTLVVHDGPAPTPEIRQQLSARRVRIIEGPVQEIVVGADGEVSAVALVSGEVLPAQAVVVGPRYVARAEVVAPLGLRAVPDPSGLGEVLESDATGATTVPGVYVAGNVTDLRGQVLQAAAEGSRIGGMINADLVAEDTARAVARVPMGAAEWDERYAEHDEQMWSGHPNASLVVEVEGLTPGRALDVGCGEGADAIWLARQGWDVTAVDISEVALDRAEQAARESGATVTWTQADLVAGDRPSMETFDLVSVHYPALLRTPEEDAVRVLLSAVAPGGTLLVVGHDLASADHARAHGFDPADYVQPGDVAARLDGGWDVELHETRPRITAPGHDSPHVDDVVLRARRRA